MHHMRRRRRTNLPQASIYYSHSRQAYHKCLTLFLVTIVLCNDGLSHHNLFYAYGHVLAVSDSRARARHTSRLLLTAVMPAIEETLREFELRRA
jgi:hypothetical protein